MILPFIWRYLVFLNRKADEGSTFNAVYVGMTYGSPLLPFFLLFPYSLIPLPFFCVSDAAVWLYRRRQARIKAAKDRIQAKVDALLQRVRQAEAERDAAKRTLQQTAIQPKDDIAGLEEKIALAMRIVESVPDEDEREALARGVQTMYRKKVLKKLFGDSL